MLFRSDFRQAVCWGLVPRLWFGGVRCFGTAHARTQAVLVITFAAVALNAIGNYGLMFGNFGLPRWELTGAGVTSSTVSALMFLALLGHAQWDRQFRRYHILVRFWRSDWPRFFERSEEHTSELQSLMRISYAVFFLNK